MQTTDETYNGHANVDTWRAQLWLGNDEGLYRAALALGREHSGDVAGFEEAARELLQEFATNTTYMRTKYPDGLNPSRVVWADVLATFEPETTPCACCGDDTGYEDETYCGADCAVDHARQLAESVRELREAAAEALAVLTHAELGMRADDEAAAIESLRGALDASA